MLNSILIKNFKSYRDANLPLSPLTLLIGANASGKSNAIEALRFLSWIAQGLKLSSLKYEIQDSDILVRGRITDLSRIGMKKFELGCITSNEWENLNIEVELINNELRIINESISSVNQNFPLYTIVHKAQAQGNDIKVAYNNFKKGGKKPQLTCSDQLSVFSQLVSSAQFEKGHQKAQNDIPMVSGLYAKWLSNILFLDPVPSVMRLPGITVDSEIRGDGKNLSAVLYNLCKKQKTKNGILKFVESLPEQRISEIDFKSDLQQNVLVTLTETFGKKKQTWDATLLSDGTLRILAIAASMYSAQKGSLVVIEEIDNGVHPSRAGNLLEKIEEIAKLRDIRVLMSTHNPALLDSLPDTAIEDVVFCYRDNDKGDSKLLRLGDLDQYPELVAQDQLGRLMTKGVIDRFVKNQDSHNERVSKTKNWIKEMRRG